MGAPHTQVLPGLPDIRVVKVMEGKIVGSYMDREMVFTYAEKGDCLYRIGTRQYRIGPGRAILLPPHTPHTLKPGKGSVRHHIVHFAFHAGRTIDDWPPVVSLPPAERNKALALLTEMHEEWRRHSPLYGEVSSALLVQILALYCRHAAHAPVHETVGQRTDRNVQSALAYMHQHMAEALDVAGIARSVGLSAAYFCRVFRQYTGRSPHEYLNRMRLEKAKELLYDPRMNCSLAAIQTGFSSVHLFSRAFRRYEGQTPTQWIATHLR